MRSPFGPPISRAVPACEPTRETGPASGRLKGLYAAGADAASIFQGTYPGPGTMIGPAMVFAWRAAMDAAGVLDNYPIPAD